MKRPRDDAGKVLLVGWDAADWKVIQPLLDSGKLPTLARIVHEGVSGPLATLHPMLSPMLWTSIATGRRAQVHGIHGFEEVDPVSGQVRAASSLSRQTKAIWNILSQNGLTAQVVGWFASHPAEPLPNGGVCVSDAFFAGAAPEPPTRGAVHPPELSSLLADLRVHEEDIDADVLSLFVPRWEEAARRQDWRLAKLRRELAGCFSVHAVATYLLEHEPAANFTAVYHPVIDHVSHYFMAYHPPRLEGIPEDDFDLYSEVVNGIYRLQDLLLRRMLDLAGEETTVLIVSDHGFRSDSQRPLHVPPEDEGLLAWHRPVGLLAARGPAFLQDELVHGASLLDIAPTILGLFGLPPGADMEGRVLREAWRTPSSLPAVPIPSWEAVPGQDGRHPVGLTLHQEESVALHKQFETLGYVGATSGGGAGDAADRCRRQNRWNLARSLLDAERAADALPLLEDLHHERPEYAEFALQLANCQLALGLTAEARVTIADVIDGREDHPFAKLLLARIALSERDFAGSLTLLHSAVAAEPTLPGLNNQLGLALIHHASWDEAEAAFRRALELDGDNAHAHLGIAHTLLRRRRFPEAAEWALAALGLAFHLAPAHFTLGLALARLGEFERATSAFEACLRFAPNNLATHRLLSRVYVRIGDHARASQHRRAALRSESRWRVQQRQSERLREEITARAASRADARRRERAQTMPPRDLAPARRENSVTVTTRPLEFVIVSGLPRSGTSLMMQLLEAGGMQIKTDRKRAADDNNPRGYLEWEEIQQIGARADLLDDEALDGTAIKCVSMLLPDLPTKHRYKVIFMTRPIREVAASQEKMMRHLGAGSAPLKGKALEQALESHRSQILAWLANAPHMNSIEIDYPTLVRDPAPTIAPLLGFLAPARLPNFDAMVAVVDPSLHRER